MLSRGDICGSDSQGFCSGVRSSDRLVVFRELILEPPFRMGRLTVITAGQSLCEFSVGMVIERRTLFQHANQSKWGFLPISEYVGISGWPGRDGGGNGPEVLSQKNGVNKMRNKSFQLLELFWFFRRRIL